MKRFSLFLCLLMCIASLPAFAVGTTEYSFIPAGTIWMYGGATAPNGWAFCDGTIASDTAYSGEFVARIAHKYNRPGDPTDSTRRPDFQGVFPKGFGTNGHLGANYADASGTPQLDKAQGHNHYLYSTDASLYIRIFSWTAPAAGGGEGLQSSGAGTIAKAMDPIADATNGTPRTGKVTEPANVGCYFMIKL